MNGSLQKAVVLTGLYICVQVVSYGPYAFIFEVQSKQLFNNTSGQNHRRFTKPVMRKQKCLFYIAEYHFPFKLIFDEVYSLSKRPLGLTIFRFYGFPRI